MSSASTKPSPERALVCVAWPIAKINTYVGQIVGSVLPDDIFARYSRTSSSAMLMISGGDGHGTPK
jgi:methionyl-tRNA synthetase